MSSLIGAIQYPAAKAISTFSFTRSYFSHEPRESGLKKKELAALAAKTAVIYQMLEPLFSDSTTAVVVRGVTSALPALILISGRNTLKDNDLKDRKPTSSDVSSTLITGSAAVSETLICSLAVLSQETLTERLIAAFGGLVEGATVAGRLIIMLKGKGVYNK